MNIANWVTTADGCVHTANRTQLDCAVDKFVSTRCDSCQLNSHCRQSRCVGVRGVYIVEFVVFAYRDQTLEVIKK